MGQNKTIVVKYDDMYVKYTNVFSELEHAYAITVHKSQGSEWPVTISPISKSNSVMLNRNMLYTMCTRATSKNYMIDFLWIMLLKMFLLQIDTRCC